MGLFKNKNRHAPFAGDTHQRTLHKNLDFTATEQYKLLRANLHFTIPEGTKCPVIGVTSSMRGEGKSTTAVNLSYVLAEQGSKVLLIDGDLRIPSVAKKMDIPGSPGLTDVLMDRDVPTEAFKSEILDNWYVMPSGDIPPNPSELLGSHRMALALERLREVFDYIVIDLPPVNIVSDALAIAAYITGMVVVIREDYTEKKELEHCFRQLKLSDVNVLGCVMNEAKAGGGAYGKYKYRNYRYYKYYRYEYKTHDEDADGDKKDGKGAEDKKK
ncbi:MAG: CpsD/CapB family tyrosine-protein kinase [Clostridia bacterium]|nr:CpsD/CapB family tyrosine-protein kinase [Clostridia bacterium]